MTDGVETLDCPSGWKDVSGKASGGGSGRTKSVARTRARHDIYRQAVSQLQDLYKKYKCEVGCHLIVEITLDSTELDQPGPDTVGFHCSGHRKWSGRVRCTNQDLGHVVPEDVEEQDLDCEEEAVGRGTAKGDGEGIDEDTASRHARDNLQTTLDLAIEGALLVADGVTLRQRVRCDDEDCPKQTIRVTLGEILLKCSAPTEADGDWKCDAKQDWRVRITCAA